MQSEFKNRKNRLAVCALILLTGCAATQRDDRTEVPDAQGAVLLPNIGHKNSTYETRPAAVDDRHVGGFFGPASVKVSPGSHRVRVSCSSPMYSASPSISYEFRAGHYYELTCRDIGDGLAAAGVVDHGTKMPAQ